MDKVLILFSSMIDVFGIDGLAPKPKYFYTQHNNQIQAHILNGSKLGTHILELSQILPPPNFILGKLQTGP